MVKTVGWATAQNAAPDPAPEPQLGQLERVQGIQNFTVAIAQTLRPTQAY